MEGTVNGGKAGLNPVGVVKRLGFESSTFLQFRNTMQLLREEMDLSRSWCAYKGLGCGKEDKCWRKGKEVLGCNLRPYMLFLDNWESTT